MMISIVIPAREEEAEIEKSVRQFSALTLPHEIIVSDARSNDRTVEIARAAGAQVVEGDGTRSPSHQRNRGAHAAKGEYILFVDTTVIIPNIDATVREALSHFADSNVVGLCVPLWINPAVATFADNFFLGIINFIIRLQTIGSGKFMLVRRSAFEKIHGFREELMTREDGDLFIRLKTVGTVVFDAKILIYYSGRREHAWGWPKLIYIWTRDTISVILFGHSASADWAPVGRL